MADCPALIVADVEQLPPLGQLAPLATAREKSIPVPVRLTLCGAPGIVTEPVRLPAAVGVKVTLIVQLRSGPRDEPHVSVSAKSPVIVTGMVIAVFCSFVSVIVCAELVLPTACLANVKLVGVANVTEASFETKASLTPPKTFWYGLALTEKSVDVVCPVT